MHILFAGGGTAGHINPALAVAAYLSERYPDCRISYIGTDHGLERKIVPAAGYDFYTIRASGFQRKLTLSNIRKNVRAVSDALAGSLRAKKLLRELKPDVVVGTGGYVSGPVLREAAKLGIKTAIHEQNAFPGVTTKMLLHRVDRVMLAMPEAEKRLPHDREYIVTGNPIRESLTMADRDACRKKLGVGEKPFVLSFGGSLGARAINDAVIGLAEHAGIEKDFHLYIGTGKSGYDTVTKQLRDIGIEENDPNVTATEYIHNMDELLAAADLVICRAGAITLAEIEACGKPAVLIPSPYVAENHQYFNALTLKNREAGELIEEKDLSRDSLCKMVFSLLQDPERLCNMGKNASSMAILDANRKIADVILSLL